MCLDCVLVYVSTFHSIQTHAAEALLGQQFSCGCVSTVVIDQIALPYLLIVTLMNDETLATPRRGVTNEIMNRNSKIENRLFGCNNIYLDFVVKMHFL